MKGLTYQLNIYAHIDEAINSTAALPLQDGKITNTATFIINTETIYTDKASVIPPPLYGFHLTKTGDRLNDLGEPDQLLANVGFEITADPASPLPTGYSAI